MVLNKDSRSYFSRLSVTAKLGLMVALVFMVIVIAITSFFAKNEKERMLSMAENHAKEITHFYFDSLNTMMLTGTMDQRDILRKKIIKRPGVIDARVLRAESVSQQYGPGLSDGSELPRDDLDRRALAGEEILQIESTDSGRELVVLTPFRATSNNNGVDCLACHNVAPGTVNGAVRVEFSLAELDKAVEEDTTYIVIASMILLIAGISLILLGLRRWLSQPFSEITEVLRARQAGDRAIRIPINGDDEIGKLSLAFNGMTDTMDDMIDKESSSANDMRGKIDELLHVVNLAAEGDLTGKVNFDSRGSIGKLGRGLQAMIDNLRSLMDERETQIDVLKNKVEDISQVVNRAGSGDLTGRINLDGSDSLSDMARGVQAMIDNLNDLVAQVQRSGISVSSSATEIAATSKQQEVTIAQQATTVNDIVATATEISATSKELLNTMDDVSNVADSTAQSATEGQELLTRMESTMLRVVKASETIGAKLEVLSEKASNINSVVTTITKVADQTNLLSLNAAIEAEKAGEYGVGFSVVATEIRRLADQSAVATLDIEQMVKEMQAAVSAGVMSVDKFSEEVRSSVDDMSKVSGQLVHIIEQVQKLTPRFEDVHEGMQFQSKGADQIKQTIVQLNDAAQQTLDSIRQSTITIERLNDAAQSLQGGVSRFKVSA
ncbi:MAG: HAMP domain-containing protein [Thiotrichales bacterium]|nr:HAMP domain-containing protein [Thiotrichales bacterium]